MKLGSIGSIKRGLGSEKYEVNAHRRYLENRVLRVSVTYPISEAGTNVMKWPPAFVLDEFVAG